MSCRTSGSANDSPLVDEQSTSSTPVDGLSIQNAISCLDPIVSADQDCQANVKLSKRRWALLFAVFVFGFTSSLVDETSSILHTVLELLDLPLDKYIYIGQLFLYLPIITTIPTAWLIDRYGIKFTMYFATLLMFIRNFSRALLYNSDLPHWKNFRLLYWVVTSMAGMQILATYYCVPLKISENWFAASERSFAWTVMISSSSIGTCIAAALYPRYIHHIKDLKPLYYLNIITAIVTSCSVFVCITSSKPKYPPSERMIKSSTEAMPYFRSISKMFKQKNILLHLLHEAIFLGTFIPATFLIQDILQASGHSKIFVGNLIASNAIISLVAILSLSTLVHRLNNNVLICKLASLAQAVMLVIHLLTLLYPLSWWIVLLVSYIFNISRSWASPNFNNMTAHLSCGVVSEATISGFTSTLSLIIVTISQVIFVTLRTETNNGNATIPDYTKSIIYSSSISIINSVIYVYLFGGKAASLSRERSVDDNLSANSATNPVRIVNQ